MFCRRLWTLILIAVFAVGARAGVIGYDGFENHQVGTPLYDVIEMEGLSPDVGTDWVLSWVQQNKTSYVTDAVAYSGTQAQSVRRVPGASQGVFTGFGTGVPIDVAKQYVFSSMYYIADDAYALDNCGTNMVSCGPTLSGVVNWNHFGMTASYNEAVGVWHNVGSGSYVNTYYVPVAGRWYLTEMVVDIGVDDGTGQYPTYYDTFFTDMTTGIRTEIAHRYWGKKLTAAAIAYGWEINTGAGAFAIGSTNQWNQVYFDDLTIIPEPMTVSLLGLGGIALFRRFRR